MKTIKPKVVKAVLGIKKSGDIRSVISALWGYGISYYSAPSCLSSSFTFISDLGL